MGNSKGKIIMEPGLNIWPHELKTAEALARAGHTVEFVRKSEVDHQRSADILMDGEEWEVKSPLSNRLPRIQRTLRRAMRQSRNIIYDSQRVRGLDDRQILRELEKLSSQLRSLKRLIFVNRKREVIVVK